MKVKSTPQKNPRAALTAEVEPKEVSAADPSSGLPHAEKSPSAMIDQYTATTTDVQTLQAVNRLR